MPDSIEHWPDLTPLPTVLDALNADIDRRERHLAVARLRDIQSKAEAGLERKRRELDDAYRATVHADLDVETLGQAAVLFGEKEQAAAERLVPRIDALRGRLAFDTELSAEEQVIFQAINAAAGHMKLYRDTREALIKLARERGGLTMPLVARPVEGKVDHEALSREFMARFPKLRAALAK